MPEYKHKNYGTPREHCLAYFINERIDNPEFLSKADFDKIVDEGDFTDGPYASSFGSGYGEPYNPWRQAYGKTKDGRGVFCELHSVDMPNASPA